MHSRVLKDAIRLQKEKLWNNAVFRTCIETKRPSGGLEHNGLSDVPIKKETHYLVLDVM